MEGLIEHSFNTNRTGGHHSRSAQHFEQSLLESWAERFFKSIIHAEIQGERAIIKI